MSQYLMIQNPGECPVEGFMLLGVSTTRNHGNADTIGEFGSGNKMATNVLLRHGLKPTVFLGRTRLDFGTDTKSINDGLAQDNYGAVWCQLSGHTNDGKTINRKQELGYALEYGAKDWTRISMALREYISNAIDRTLRQDGEFEKALKIGSLAVKVVEENQVRAKAGFTRVFVAFEGEVVTYFAELGKRFLHFREPESLKLKLLKPNNRNLRFDESKGEVRKAMIYKKGVFVREVNCDESALYDYNFNSEIELDECRNCTDYQVRDGAARALMNADVPEIAGVFSSLLKNEKVWEATFDRYQLTPSTYLPPDKRDKITKNWQDAWKLVAGDACMTEDIEVFKEIAKRKGVSVIALPSYASGFIRGAEHLGVAGSTRIFTESEQKGQIEIDPTPAALEALDRVWGWLEEVEMTFGKTKPPCRCFKELMQRETKTFGYYLNGVVYINEYHADNGVSKELLDTMLEELGHYITGATDNSRDFQSFFIQALVRKFSKEIK